MVHSAKHRLRSLKLMVQTAGFLALLSTAVTALSQPVYYNPIELLNDRKKVSIPFTFVNNFIIIDAHVFGLLPVHFIFDTGAEHVVIFKREYTDVLNIEYDKRIPIMGSDLSREVYSLIVRNAMLEVDGLRARPTDMLVLEENYFNFDEILGIQVAGLIGGGYFSNLITEIDYKHRKLTFWDPKHFTAPEDFMSIPVTIRTHKPYINTEAGLQNGTTVQVDLLVDTGAGIPLLLHNNTDPSLKLPDAYIRGKLGMGLGGFVEGYIGRINKLNLGGLEFPHILTSFQDLDETWMHDKDRFRNGLLGNQLLSRFTIIIDYIRGQLYLKPYSKRQEPFNMDRSGLILLAYGQQFNRYVIKDVMDNSPAADAGIRSDDVLMRVQGMAVEFLTLERINRILQRKPGSKVKLTLLREGEILHKTLILRDLI